MRNLPLGQWYVDGRIINSWEPVTDNSHLIPEFYKWTCSSCKFCKTHIEIDDCGCCELKRSVGAIAWGMEWDAQSKAIPCTKWKVVKCDRDGNQHWEVYNERKRGNESIS